MIKTQQSFRLATGLVTPSRVFVYAESNESSRRLDLTFSDAADRGCHPSLNFLPGTACRARPTDGLPMTDPRSQTSESWLSGYSRVEWRCLGAHVL